MSGTLIDYVCDEFYVKNKEDDYILLCQDNGTWNSTVIPRCTLGTHFFIYFSYF